jgi:hypothetical protein
MASIGKNTGLRLRIFSEKALVAFLGSIFELAAFSALQMSSAVRTGGFSRQLSENAIELGERLEPHGKCDFADPKIDIVQKPARLFEARAGDVTDKIYAGHLLELFAQMIRTDAHRFRYFCKRKFIARMYVDEISRFPDLNRFGPTVLELIRNSHHCPPTNH